MTRDQQGTSTDEDADCRLWIERHGATWSRTKARDPGARDAQTAKLAQIIEGRVIPQMLLAHRGEGFLSPLQPQQRQLGYEERVGEFADLVIKRTAASATAYFEDMLADGASVEVLFAELLGPTARRLGELWEEDINTMVDVTQGLAHLQHLVRIFAPEMRPTTDTPSGGRRALLMAMPGEQHSFGVSLVEQYFRRDGWHVWGGPPGTLEEVTALVGGLWFDMVGFSVATITDAALLARDLRVVREAARNKNIAIMIGGQPFVRQPALAAIVGADATAADGAGALRHMSSMLGRPATG